MIVAVNAKVNVTVSVNKKVYVKSINSSTGDVVISDNEKLFEKELIADQVNWTKGFEPSNNMKVKAKIRYNAIEQEAKLKIISENKISVIFDKPVRAITPGQPVVLYENDKVLGGGIIKNSIPLETKANV